MRATISWDHQAACLKVIPRESVMERIAIAVLYASGEVLIGPRPDGDALAGLWEFPGGKINPGETPAAAAVRECREETGLEVIVLGTCAEVLHRYPIGENPSEQASGPHLELHLSFFACRPLERFGSVASPFRWVGLEHLPSLDFPAANHSLIAQFADVDFIHRFWGEPA